MPIIATTIKISISVNPRTLFLSTAGEVFALERNCIVGPLRIESDNLYAMAVPWAVALFWKIPAKK